MKYLLFSLSFLILSTSYASTNSMLSFYELKKLNTKKRNVYLRNISKELILMSPKKKYSFIQLFLENASAAGPYKCVSGGIPIPAGGTCGTNSYAGFTCPEGQQICNPSIFGVYLSGEPVCFPTATTTLCYKNTVVGTNTTTDPVFAKDEAEIEYNNFANEINAICDSGNSTTSFEDGAANLATSCHQIKRQTELNRTRNLVGFSNAVDPTNGVVDPSADADLTGIEADPNNPCSAPQLTKNISGQGNGSIPELSGSAGTARDGQVLSALRSGNIPSFLKKLKPVKMNNSHQCKGQSGDIILCSMPDYLAVGNDENYVHTPLGLSAAMTIAKEMGFMLPTTTMVDQIYSSACDKLSPSTRTPDGSMTTTAVMREHSTSVQRSFTGCNGIRAGHKKDLVITNRMVGTGFGNVPIYGWHRKNGNPIQPLYLGHGGNYADYSHGIRLISQAAFIDGKSYSLQELLKDPNCASALSREGAIRSEVLRQFGNPEITVDPNNSADPNNTSQ